MLYEKLKLSNSLFGAQWAEAASIKFGWAKEDGSACIPVKATLCEDDRHWLLLYSLQLLGVEMTHWEGISKAGEVFRMVIQPSFGSCQRAGGDYARVVITFGLKCL